MIKLSNARQKQEKTTDPVKNREVLREGISLTKSESANLINTVSKSDGQYV